MAGKKSSTEYYCEIEVFERLSEYTGQADLIGLTCINRLINNTLKGSECSRYIVNLNEVKKYVRGDGGFLVMCDGSTVNVSRIRKEALLKWFS